MFHMETIINFVLLAIIAIVCGYLIGLSVTNVVNQRLSEISFTLPKINIQQENIKETFVPDADLINHPQPQQASHPPQQPPQPPPQQASHPPQSSCPAPQKPPIATEVGTSQTSPTDPIRASPSVGCTTHSDCNVVYGNGANRCLVNHQCYCNTGSGQFCQYGPTYYKDPKDMTPSQVRRFMYRANFDQMTLQDYINWLTLFEEEPDELSARHLSNLHKMRKGIPLTRQDIPRDQIPPPLTAQDYFAQMSLIDQQNSPRNLDTGGLQLPSNYMDYSSFDTPKNLKHLENKDHDLELEKYEKRETLKQTRPRIEHNWNN
jgi:hypothetical protein